MRNNYDHILERMTPITLEEMRTIHLMDRIDSKFVIPITTLPLLLEALQSCYKVQFHNNRRIAAYTTQYLDTPDLNMFLMHHNGKLNRQKIRIRTYKDSQLSFLEVKNKNNKGRTKKIRIPVDQSSISCQEELKEYETFLKQHTLFDCQTLKPVLSNEFERITLINKQLTERVTIDSYLSFSGFDSMQKEMMNHVAILELKQDRSKHSDFKQILSRFRIKQCAFSKYCTGIVLTNNDVKRNRFKQRINSLNKLI
ncbi:polyphosphate polymerase domain-containing protein [Parabacteroides sp. PF5-9]|uniref:polyphosphate polymerase domain-containing protein n=1 Tax=Parabacteroides sp. PF5-9 TaxID=1742404 RepID=UPI0024759205|nr:polyphosphate polymerase domain-containing protein [Parabacteroides sp. PF5-9]MDH6356514.1 hypothetical protein [Parabacteroides sp. PF5-9]